MGRTNTPATMKVYKFEKDWHRFFRAQRKTKRKAFKTLVSFAHFRAAPIAHSGSPYIFEMIFVTMLIGVVRRAEALEEKGIQLPTDAKTSVVALMTILRQRLLGQKWELYNLARALLSEEDQRALRSLLQASHETSTLTPLNETLLSNEMLLTSLVGTMEFIQREEQRYLEPKTTLMIEAWSQLRPPS